MGLACSLTLNICTQQAKYKIVGVSIDIGDESVAPKLWEFLLPICRIQQDWDYCACLSCAYQ